MKNKFTLIATIILMAIPSALADDTLFDKISGVMTGGGIFIETIFPLLLILGGSLIVLIFVFGLFGLVKKLFDKVS